ncbi:MAG: hypothetical protein R3202_03250, partial [Candidatus Competibacterales bacterium]|nr:hypothetical protein [Candidatus Competibacterales bacterium]
IAQPCWRVSFRNKGTLIAAECPLVDMLGLPEPVAADTPLGELLGLIGSGGVAAPLTLSLATARLWWEGVRHSLDLLEDRPRLQQPH